MNLLSSFNQASCGHQFTDSRDEGAIVECYWHSSNPQQSCSVVLKFA